MSKKFINACSSFAATLVVVTFLHLGSSSVYGRNVFSDEVRPTNQQIYLSPTENQNVTVSSAETTFDGFQGNLRGSFSESLDEHLKKVQQTFGLLDLRPKEDCSRRREIHMFYCPTPNPRNFKDWTCVRIDELCNGFPDCPGAEDEDPTLCMYWLAGQEQLRILKKIIVAHYQSDVESSPASRPFDYKK